MKIKICGLTRLADARFASGAQADFLGFIFWQGSKRYVKPSVAKEIIQWIDGPQCVGVFVDQPLDDVITIASEVGLDLIQLHGDESPEYCSLIQLPVIKAFKIDNDTTSHMVRYNTELYNDVVDYFLFDTHVRGLMGGTGQVFDWSILDNIQLKRPFFLSGGISSENVLQAAHMAKPFAIDVSSSIELEPGVKDLNKMDEFFIQFEQLNT